MAYSQEEKKARRERMGVLIKQVGELSPEEREEIARRMPIVTCEGHPISPYNACFLSMQTELNLTIIGGFKQWQRSGRQVSPGQKAAGYIYVPMKKKKDSILARPKRQRSLLNPDGCASERILAQALVKSWK